MFLRHPVLSRHATRGTGELLGERRPPWSQCFDLDDHEWTDGWRTLSEPTEGIVPVDHEAIHGTRLDSNKKQIRLLQLFPHEAPSTQDDHDLDDETVYCRMFKIFLDDFDPRPPLFNALSYTWGRPDDQTNIVVNDATTSVRSNLESALRHLRDYHQNATCGFPLWVDAICIDQEDVEEQNAQVEMMGDIFRRAYRVLPWLGEGDIDTDWLIPLIKDVGFRKEVEQADLVVNFAPGRVLVRAVAVAMEDLCSRSWWSRLWVVQEIMLGKRDPILVIGRESVAWSSHVLMFKLVFPIYGRIGHTTGYHDARTSLYIRIHPHLPFISTAKYPGIFVECWDGLRSDIQSKGHSSICALFGRAANLLRQSATKKPDYVYALRGLFPKEEQRLIAVDYSKTYMQVFHDAMIVVWTSSYSSAAWLAEMVVTLDYRRSNTCGKVHDVPSWVPDLPQQDFANNFTTIRSPSRTPEIQIPSHGKILILRGIYFDTVFETCSVRIGSSTHDGFWSYDPNMNDLRQAVQCVTAALSRQPPPSSALYGFSGPRYREQNMPHILRTMFDSNGMGYIFEHEWLVDMMLRKLSVVAVLDFDSAIPILLQSVGEELKQQPIGPTAHYCVNEFLSALGHRLKGNMVFTTGAGSFGVGPGHMEAGDRIVFPFGMSHPFVVRPFDPEHPETHEYTMIGVAEVPDLVDHFEKLDKALEDGFLEEIDIHLK